VGKESAGEGLLAGPAGEVDEGGETALVEFGAEMGEGIGDLTGEEQDLGGALGGGEVEETGKLGFADESVVIGSIAAIPAVPRAIVGEGNGEGGRVGDDAGHERGWRVCRVGQEPSGGWGYPQRAQGAHMGAAKVGSVHAGLPIEELPATGRRRSGGAGSAGEAEMEAGVAGDGFAELEGAAEVEGELAAEGETEAGAAGTTGKGRGEEARLDFGRKAGTVVVDLEFPVAGGVGGMETDDALG